MHTSRALAELQGRPVLLLLSACQCDTPPPPHSNVLRISGYVCTMRAFAELEARPWLPYTFPYGNVTLLLLFT